jgi:hypothetical protein
LGDLAAAIRTGHRSVPQPVLQASPNAADAWVAPDLSERPSKLSKDYSGQAPADLGILRSPRAREGNFVRRLIVILTISTIGLTGAALFATPAVARVSSGPNLCKSLQNLHYTPSSDPTSAGGKANATKLSKAFAKIAKQAKGNIKSTLNTMASYFKAAAAGDATALQNQAQAFGTAAQNFASYLVSSCTAGLPGGVTIPKIPTIPST